MSTAETSASTINAGMITRRVLFFILMIMLSLLYLIIMFRGLDSPKGMEQAQIGRELARNNGFQSKVLRPVSIYQNSKVNGGQPNLAQASRDTYHAPLHPILLAFVLKFFANSGDPDEWRMAEADTVYKLDRIIAGTCVVCFLMAIGVNYLLISRIFDAKIGGVTALLMLLCDLNWQFSQTGLPQMFMLLLFSLACFFAYRAVENTEEGRVAIVPALIAGAFFGLLALTHWLTIWIILGFALYAGFFIRPRGAAGIAALGFVLILSIVPLIKNKEYTGSVGGTAIYSVFNGLGTSEDEVMRTYDVNDINLSLQNLPFKVVRTMLLQSGDLYVNLGSILTAPFFFLALLHPFKRKSIASFRWCLLLMWLFGAVGMSIFGMSGNPTDSNQLHILFAPLFAAYGLAFVAILWSRLKLPTEIPQLGNAHFIVVILISAGPLVFDLPRQIKTGIAEDGVQAPHWPPYYPSALNTRLPELTLEKEIIVSDQPWAVAWYADRKSIWLPKTVDDFIEFEGLASNQGSPIAGILVSPYSQSSNPLTFFREYGEWSPLLLDGVAATAIRRGPGYLASQQPKIRAIVTRYPNPASFNNNLLVYWSSEPAYSNTTDR